MTQAQHAQQAAELARAEGHPPHVLIGALLHDVGNLDRGVLGGLLVPAPAIHTIDPFHDSCSNGNVIEENVFLLSVNGHNLI